MSRSSSSARRYCSCSAPFVRIRAACWCWRTCTGQTTRRWRCWSTWPTTSATERLAVRSRHSVPTKAASAAAQASALASRRGLGRRAPARRGSIRRRHGARWPGACLDAADLPDDRARPSWPSAPRASRSWSRRSSPSLLGDGAAGRAGRPLAGRRAWSLAGVPPTFAGRRPTAASRGSVAADSQARHRRGRGASAAGSTGRCSARLTGLAGRGRARRPAATA